MEKLLISACLLGRPVRYDGGHLKLESPVLVQWDREGRIVPICPEVAAGMNVPRPAAEIAGGNGIDVMNGSARVVDRDGHDVTAHFLEGAESALEKCKAHHIKVALLAESSPSCGSRTIHDGRFKGNKVPGIGVTTALLKQHGIKVFNQFEVAEAIRAVDADC